MIGLEIFGKVKNMTGFGGHQDLSNLTDSEIGSIEKEVEFMTKEYPKHPDFVKRVKSLVEDNHRLRLLVESQTSLNGEDQSNIILLQFLMYYDEVKAMRLNLETKNSSINDLIAEKDQEIARLESELSAAREENESLREEIEDLQVGGDVNQTLRILNIMKEAVDKSRSIENGSTN